ncbi:MAG: phosphoenolpyruvate--protein phosphotransferase, partial [Ignavibacteriales bacterium]
VTEGTKPGKEVSFCGEMAADTLAIPLLVGLGYKSLSMSPVTIPYAKRIIRYLNYEHTKKLAQECLECYTEKDIVNKLEKFFKDHSITRTRQII